jgi:MinD-like ATPase involved in chromosome partitioning or flagellar assembly/DNA-binding NarL/FixJ family response regulator
MVVSSGIIPEIDDSKWKAHILAVYSPQGGAGTTTIATNLASGLVGKGAKVLLVDADLQFPDVGTFLNLRAHTIADLIQDIDAVDVELIQNTTVTHDNGLKVLLGPSHLRFAEEIAASPDAVGIILEKIADYYDFIVVDTGTVFNKMLAGIFDRASKILLVATPTLICLRHQHLVLEMFDELGYAQDKTWIIINQIWDKEEGKSATVPIEKIASFLKRPVIGAIPIVDERILLRAINKGIPAIAAGSNQSEPPIKQFRELVDVICHKPVRGIDETSHLDRKQSEHIVSSASSISPDRTAEKDARTISSSLIHIMIVDSDSDYRDALQKLMVYESDFEVVGLTDAGHGCVQMAKEVQPDIIIMDINLPDMGWLEVIDILKKEVPTAGVIILSSQTDMDILRKAMRAGAQEFLTKPPTMEDIHRAIRTVNRNITTETQRSLTSASPGILSMEGSGHRPRQFALGPPALSEAHFSTYYPRLIQPDIQYSFIVYAHTKDILSDIQKDVEKFSAELGGSIPKPKTAKKSATLQFGTPITVVPECDEIDFEPESLTKKWRGHWTRFDFDLIPTPDLVDETLFVRVSIQIEGIEIAHIKCAIEVVAPETETTSPDVETSSITESVVDNPLAVAKLKLQSQTSQMYNKIFVSYSRKDTEVARAYRLAQLAAGHEVFMDTESIHTGEDWQAALAKAIDEADIFQLFWSENSAASENVQHEWDYALKYKCPEDQCRGFIRPAYWKKPMPVSPPPELSHLNFRYVPLKSGEDKKTDSAP